MNSSTEAQLVAIDRALLALMQERARLREGRAPRPAALDDLLSRSPGPLSAELVRSVFAALDAGGAS